MMPLADEATDGFLAEYHIVMNSMFRCSHWDFNLPLRQFGNQRQSVQCTGTGSPICVFSNDTNCCFISTCKCSTSFSKKHFEVGICQLET